MNPDEARHFKEKRARLARNGIVTCASTVEGPA